jgi:tetratricopeptide (TPR) repeat protein
MPLAIGENVMKVVRISVIAFGLIVTCGAASSVQAAVSVVGAGMAHTCYVQAEFGDDLKAGIAICSESLKSDVLSRIDRASTLINRAILRARTADTDGAMADYAEALSLGSNDGEVYLNRSATLIALRRYSEALHDADQAVALHPARVEIAYYNRALANEALGNVGAAYQDYKAALEAQPQFKAASERLAHFHVVQGSGA